MSLEDEVDIVNREPRCPCVLLLDTSGSMHGTNIDALNRGLVSFRDEIVKDPLVQLRVELCIITFGGEVKVLQDFITMDNFEPPLLRAHGTTPMAEAILKALQVIDDRKEKYKRAGIDYYRPMVLLITDGIPSDPQYLSSVSLKVKEGEQKRNFVFLSVGFDEADFEILNSIGLRKAMPLKGLNFQGLFQWLSASMAAVSASQTTDEKVSLPPVQNYGWAEI
jgi:uncharacterized protein YegL